MRVRTKRCFSIWTSPFSARRGPLLRAMRRLLRAGDLIVFNDTRVIRARLRGQRHRNGARVAVEATLHRRLSPSRWTAFMKPGKRLAPGDRLLFGQAEDRACALNML